MRFSSQLILGSVIACGVVVVGAAGAIAQTRPTILRVEVISVTSVAPGDATLNVDGAGTVYVY